MLADAGARYAIAGHSERRSACGETDVDVRRKAAAIIAAGMTPILCVGETVAGALERTAGQMGAPAGACCTSTYCGGWWSRGESNP
ncbi:hypothetical protein EAH87_10160 [Sphingomonas koreensis]|nr:hypothetical protein EAH87_10160 [Sphingomonas koreensis]